MNATAKIWPVTNTTGITEDRRLWIMDIDRVKLERFSNGDLASLSGAFRFGRSKQGHDFWMDIIEHGEKSKNYKAGIEAAKILLKCLD